MNRIEAWLLHISTIVLTLSGALYAVMHYLMKPSDPYSVVNHPWEPYLIDIHILSAPVLIVLIGIILHTHVLLKMQNGSRVGRKSGTSLLPLFAVMVLSGYLLQIVSGDARKLIVIAHLASGMLWFLFYVVHHLASLKVRRALAKQNGSAKLGPDMQPPLLPAHPAPDLHLGARTRNHDPLP